MADKLIGYCVKHKGKVAMKDPTLHRMEGRGRLGYAAKGSCPQDGTGMFKIMSEEQYKALKASGLKEGETIKKKAKKAKRSKSGGSSASGSASGGRRRRRSTSKGKAGGSASTSGGRRKRRSRSKGRK